MVSSKRVILGDGARLLREMLHHVINKADHLEVVREVTHDRELAEAIEKFDPEWVIISAPFNAHSHNWIHEYPSVRFIFLSPNDNYIKMRWQMSCDENYPDLSLTDFIRILEKDPQRT